MPAKQRRGVTTNDRQLVRGRSRLAAASKNRSAGAALEGDPSIAILSARGRAQALWRGSLLCVVRRNERVCLARCRRECSGRRPSGSCPEHRPLPAGGAHG
jgi:hypothetical protein